MKRVAIIDSGSGGVNVLISMIKACPFCNYLLFIDDKNLPYGEKDKIQLEEIAIQIVEHLKQIFNPEVIIIGCNTLTCTAIDLLRKRFKEIFFIGSEPAILPALKEFNKDEILVLATDVTIKNSKILRGYEDLCFCPRGLPSIIDENLFERQNIAEFLNNELKGKKARAIVLGCTHFEGITSELCGVFDNPKFYFTSTGMAKRLKSHIKTSNSYQVQIMTSNKTTQIKFYQYFKSML